MDGLSQLIVNGNPTALNLVKTLLDAPMLINPSITKDGLSARRLQSRLKRKHTSRRETPK